MLILKQYDTPLLSFEIEDDPLEGQKCRLLHLEEENRALLPTGMEASDAGLMKWMRDRIIPKNRTYSDALLAKSGLSHNDTRSILRVCRNEEAAYWYRYITTCTLLNCWDSICASLNGMD